jgi:methyl-accepting chemotaxis protein
MGTKLRGIGMFKNYSITTKLMLGSLISLFGVLVIGVAVITFRASNLTEDASVYTARQVALKEVALVQSNFNIAQTAAKDIAQVSETLVNNGNFDRKLHERVIHDMLKSNPVVNGLWSVYLPDKFDGRDADFANFDALHDASGQFRPYYFRKPDGSIDGEPTSPVSLDKQQDASWFFNSYNKRGFSVSRPYTYEAGGNTVVAISFSMPIMRNGEVVGVAGSDMSTMEIARSLMASKPFETGNVYMISENGIWLAHANPAFLGKNIDETHANAADYAALKEILKNRKGVTLEGYSEALQSDVVREIYPLHISGAEGALYIVANIPTSTIFETAHAITTLIIAVGVVLMLALAIVLWITGRKVIRTPIAATIQTIQSLMGGDYNTRIDFTDRNDEIGEINKALVVFKEASLEREKMAAAQQAEDTKRLRRAEKMEQLINTFSNSVGTLMQSMGGALHGLNDAAQSLSTSAQQTSGQSTAVAAASEQASANVETVAAASEELFASVREIGRQVESSSQIASHAVTQATDTNDKIEGLARSASQIGEVVKLINDIANQTNLLALNATIEAARAGEAGKGFAVVANEVKSLANQTARATEDITQQIQGIQTETTDAVGAIQKITRTIEDMNAITSSISAAVEEQGAATQEISRNVQEASQGTQEVSSNIAGVSTAANTTKDASDSVFVSAKQLQDEADRLQRDVDDFLTGIRHLD